MTKIYGTLGPACDRVETLEAMLGLGMTGLRLNLSHMSLADAEPMLAALRTASAESGRLCAAEGVESIGWQ